jgi:hypothetical protein
MAAKLTRQTDKITIQLHLVVESCIFAVLAPGSQSGNFLIHPLMYQMKCVDKRQHRIYFRCYEATIRNMKIGAFKFETLGTSKIIPGIK